MFRRNKPEPPRSTNRAQVPPAAARTHSPAARGAAATAVAEPPTSQPGRRFSDNAQAIDTLIDASMHIKGTLTGSENIEIRGRVEGDIHITGLLVLGTGASIKGDVSATDAIVEGELEGSLNVDQKLEMRATSRVVGDIRAASMAMAEGCRYEGKVAIGAGPSATAAPLSFREKRASDGAAT